MDTWAFVWNLSLTTLKIISWCLKMDILKKKDDDSIPSSQWVVWLPVLQFCCFINFFCTTSGFREMYHGNNCMRKLPSTNNAIRELNIYPSNSRENLLSQCVATPNISVNSQIKLRTRHARLMEQLWLNSLSKLVRPNLDKQNLTSLSSNY